MATLHVRNIPDELYEQLRRRAEAQGRSLSAEVVILLDRALEGEARDPAKILAEIRRRRSYRPSVVGAPDSTALLRADRDR